MRRTRTSRRPAIDYTPDHRLQLTTGFDFFGSGFGEGPDFREADARQAWAYLREDLLLEHIGLWPCTRPWAWWQFEDHPPRRVVRRPQAEGKWYESQANYLRRHGFITRAESEYLEANPSRLEPVAAIDSSRR